MYIDAHAHIAETIPVSSGSYVFLAATSLSDCASIARHAVQCETVYPFFGIHPWKAKDLPADWETQLQHYLEATDGGVGEIGLDKPWAEKHGEEFSLERQSDIFLRQLVLAQKYERPATIHCVHAWEQLFSILDQALRQFNIQSIPGIVHYYTGSAELAARILNYGLSISFRPMEHEKIIPVIQSIPGDRLFLESDLPGGYTFPAQLAHYQTVARIRGTDRATLTEEIRNNAQILTGRKIPG